MHFLIIIEMAYEISGANSVDSIAVILLAAPQMSSLRVLSPTKGDEDGKHYYWMPVQKILKSS